MGQSGTGWRRKNRFLSPSLALGGRNDKAFMKNIQIIDGAANATYSIFQATDE
jgi:hypothetical protein